MEEWACNWKHSITAVRHSSHAADSQARDAVHVPGAARLRFQLFQLRSRLHTRLLMPTQTKDAPVLEEMDRKEEATWRR